jgi:succinylglutamic semialdehyde dehydrogenase
MKFLGNFLNGHWVVAPSSSQDWVVKSPADLDRESLRCSTALSHVDEAVEAAKNAFPHWRRTPLASRIALFQRLGEEIQSESEALAAAISLEIGKPLWEAKTEVSSVLQKIEVTLSQGLQRIESELVENVLPSVEGRIEFRPLGVMAVLGPFNFPAHLPHGHWTPGLLLGNTIVYKPSERAPLVGQILAGCFERAGFPPGVFNLVHGAQDVGQRLVTHLDVSAIAFTGSYEVGVRIQKAIAEQPWKLLALEMGGKNPLLVLEDADLDLALREAFFGTYVTTGQRCASTSRILVHERIADRFVQEFHRLSKDFRIGPPEDEVFMGPLIDGASVERHLKAVGIGEREGFEVLMRPKSLEPKACGGKRGHYVTPSVLWRSTSTQEGLSKSIFLKTEWFTPTVSIEGFRTDDEALQLANLTDYGLVASIFTADRDRFHRVRAELEFGLVNWNRGTVGASGKLPFGGLKRSGNHRPAGIFSVHYSADAVSVIEGQAGITQWVGSPWKK